MRTLGEKSKMKQMKPFGRSAEPWDSQLVVAGGHKFVDQESFVDGTTFKSDSSFVSSGTFSSSQDILEIIKFHPDYVHAAPDVLEPILAGVVSGLAIAGGVLVIFVSGGTAGAGAAVLGSTLLVTGTTGAAIAVDGAINGNFSWGRFGQDVAISAGVTLITFGAAFGTGACIGIALRGSLLTSDCMRMIASSSSALIGAGTRGGTCYLFNEMVGRETTVIKLCIEVVSGAVQGAFAGYLGVEATLQGQPPNVTQPFRNHHLEGDSSTAMQTHAARLNENLRPERNTLIEITPRDLNWELARAVRDNAMDPSRNFTTVNEYFQYTTAVVQRMPGPVRPPGPGLFKRWEGIVEVSQVEAVRARAVLGARFDQNLGEWVVNHFQRTAGG